MSEVFFQALGAPKPTHRLGIFSGSRGETAVRQLMTLRLALKLSD